MINFETIIIFILLHLEKNIFEPGKYIIPLPGDDLGAVECAGVPLADLPHQLDGTRVFALTLAGNGMRKFPAGKLRDMGEG